MEKAALLMDSVHDGVGLGRVQVGFEAPASGRAAGEYLPASGFRDARIMVSDLTRTPVLTGLHEYGHHVEKQLAPADGGMAAGAKFRRIIFQTPRPHAMSIFGTHPIARHFKAGMARCLSLSALPPGEENHSTNVVFQR